MVFICLSEPYIISIMGILLLNNYPTEFSYNPFQLLSHFSVSDHQKLVLKCDLKSRIMSKCESTDSFSGAVGFGLKASVRFECIFFFINRRAYFQKGLDPLSWLRRKMCFFVRVCTHVYEKLNIEFTITSFCSLYSDLKCFLKVGRKLNNVVILVTRFWPKVDLTPFGNKLFICKQLDDTCLIIFIFKKGLHIYM